MAKAAARNYPSVKYNVTMLGGGQTQAGVSFPGGYDLTTPSLALQPGALRDCINFECSQSGGYGRIAGYERYSGQIAPSSATYQIVQVLAFVNTPTVGQVITQATSGATGTIIAVATVPQYLTTESGIPITDESGNYIYVSPLCYVAVTLTSGTFDTTHDITTPGPVTVGTATATTVMIDSETSAIYTAAAADVYRALISAVPGSGAVLGVVHMVFGGDDFVYAFRANVGGTAVNLYQSSSSGWVQIPFFNSVNFTVGTAPGGAGADYQPPDGATITQSGHTATIQRVMWQSGSFNSNSAVGTLIVTTPSGGNFTSGTATISDGTIVTLAGAQAPITLLPGGHFEFVKCNFSGQLVTRRIYGCDGVNKAFEFDGTTLSPITTGLNPDAPSHIAFHKNFLFLSYASSIFYSGVGTPFKWDAIDGGGEIATGDIVTGMITLPGSQTSATLAVYLRSNTAFLYGLDPTTFNFTTFNTGQGALPGSIQNLADTFVFDDLGVITLKTTLNYGNFLPSTLTRNILPFILQERTKLCASTVNRAKSQYRAFFSDGYGLWLTAVNQQYLGSAPVLFPNPVYCVDDDEDSDGNEVTYFGSNDGLGYVYQMEVGTSFDGANIDAHITLAWDAIKSPRILKLWRAASIEIQSDNFVRINFGYQLGYGTPSIGQPSAVSYASNFAGAPQWGSFVWGQFTWDGKTLSPTYADMTGRAENVQYVLSSSTNYIAAFQLNSVVTHYSMGRGLRG